MSFRNINPSKVATIKHINNLITCLVNITDETGQFLMPLADGRVIDTKGWEDWEVSVGQRGGPVDGGLAVATDLVCPGV